MVQPLIKKAIPQPQGKPTNAPLDVINYPTFLAFAHLVICSWMDSFENLSISKRGCVKKENYFAQLHKIPMVYREDTIRRAV